MAGRPLQQRRQADVPARLRGDGTPVIVVPGFLSSDRSTVYLRRTLGQAGYRAYGWRQGFNLGARRDLLERIAARVDNLHARYNRPVALIGWSLGGIFAREVAKLRPEGVARVITLGAPFSGSIRANHAWRLYELMNDHKVDAPPVACRMSEKPPVRTIAIWSPDDGIVSAASARGLPGEMDASVEVRCNHVLLTSAPPAVRAILEALAAR